ncbi:MAG: Hsp20/alpha crystallin family protein [Ignavibacteriae bacterium]|nr:Hsp20/alpha crystallin family protein [Ignavibacteria bacterium]MBI3364876.1 Hsp20/alpha crystallin family protein [Ignavibacteriota bacterium]
MTLIRWNPLRDVTVWHPVSDLTNEIVGMQREIDRMFERFRGGTVDDSHASMWIPAVDVVEKESEFIVKAELPGVDRKDVKITVQNDILTISGEKRHEEEKNDRNYQRVERSYGSFQRSFTLPSTVANDRIEAAYDNGILTVSIPKVEEAKRREIEVKVK